MSDLVGISDPDEVMKARRKLLAIRRAQRRLENRLADLDWEFEVLKPELRAFEKRIVTLGELPKFEVTDERADGDPDTK